MASQTSASGSRNPVGTERTLGETMRAPSTNSSDVIVIAAVERDEITKVVDDPKTDLWLSTVDGRHQSPIIPLRIGPSRSCFYVHHDILTKSLYFRRALGGRFREAVDQTIDLPEEDPSIFSFVVAYLYEGKFEPIRPMSHALVEDVDKGKGKANEVIHDSASDEGSDAAGSGSDTSIQLRRRRNRRRQREREAWEERQRKHPDRHRPDCNCDTCIIDNAGPPCWNCGVSRYLPPPVPPLGTRRYDPFEVEIIDINGIPIRNQRRHRDRNRPHDGEQAHADSRHQLSDEEIRTWLMAFSVSVDVYVCAERYMMQDLKECIEAYVVHRFESIGMAAAQPDVLEGCKRLFHGVSQDDSLLKKVFARVGFLLARLWESHPDETSSFMMQNPGVASRVMKETMERRAVDLKDHLPAMATPSPRTVIRGLSPFPPRVIHPHGPIRRL